MARDTDIANRLRAAGLSVVTVDGWESRGSSDFSPRGSVNHHTAGPATGNIPSLNTLIYGRADLPGPLCNVAQARNGDAYVIAAGRANHAGSGGWHGLSGNSSVYGLEIEHVGTSAEAWTEARVDTAARIQAALIRGTAGADMVCQHKEWTDRKIDAYGADGDTFRNRVARYLAGGGAPTPDEPPPPGSITMFLAIDSVGFYALVGHVLYTFRDMGAYGASKNSSPNVPALVIGSETPRQDRDELLANLVRQHAAATG